MILLENPVPIYFFGAVLSALFGATFLVRRNQQSLLTFAGVVGVTLLLVLVERLVVTDREQVEAAVVELVKAIEKNDLSTVVAAIDPAATKIRNDAETLMAMVQVEDTGATSIRVEVDRVELDTAAEPRTAVAKFLGKVDGIHKSSGQRVFYFGELHLFWVRREGQWLVENYQVRSKGKSVDAIEGVRTLDR